MIDDDAAAFEVERTSEHDAAGVDCGYRRVQLGVVVEAVMDTGYLSVEETLIAEGVRLGCEWERGKKIDGP